MTAKTAAQTVSLIAALALATLPAGCSSDDVSPAAPAPVAVDTAPPAVPTGLAAASADLVVKLSWDANTVDSDLVGYMVYERIRGRSHALVDEPLLENRFIVRHPPAECEYAVTAVDAAGNESALVVVHYLASPPPPQPVADDGLGD
jgi:hypothetical protein